MKLACIDCGTAIKGSARGRKRLRCAICKKIEMRRVAKEYYLQNHWSESKNKKPRGTIILYDPVPVEEGGFRVGADIGNMEAVRAMRKDKSFNVGTIILKTDNEKREVVEVGQGKRKKHVLQKVT